MNEETTAEETTVEEVQKEPSKAFLITHDGNFNNATVSGFPDKGSAVAASNDKAGQSLVVEGISDLEGLEIAQLVSLYNSLNDASLSRFRTLENGRERLFTSINGLVNSGNGENMSMKKKAAAKTKAPKAAKAPGEKKARKGKVDAEKKITHTDTFKGAKLREGSSRADDFAKMKNNVKVSTYLENGGSANNLRFAIIKGYVKLAE